MSIRLNLKIFIFIIIFIFTHQIKIYALLMFFGLIHEIGHMFAGIVLGFKPDTLEIMPYGLSISFNVDFKDYNKKILKGSMLSVKKIIISAAGPLTNLGIIIAFLLFDMPFIGINKSIIIYSNILIGLFNLIPIYPLDGGRIIKNILHIVFGLEKSYKYTNYISVISIILVTVLAFLFMIYYKNYMVVFILFYLWYLVLKNNKRYKDKINLYKRGLYARELD